MDPIANMLAAIKNGYLARKTQVSVPYSKVKLAIAKVLEKEKFTSTVAKSDSKITIELLYIDQKPKLNEIKRISKLGLRSYVKSKNIKPIKGGKGLIVVTTAKGIMTGYEARAKNLGGEIICQVW